MLTFEQASNLAQAELQKLAAKSSPKTPDLMIVQDKIAERTSGWVFPYNTRRFIEGKQPLAAVIGTGPIFVDKNSGSVHVLPSSRIEEWLSTYDSTGAPPERPTQWRYIGTGNPPKMDPVKSDTPRIRKKP